MNARNLFFSSLFPALLLFSCSRQVSERAGEPVMPGESYLSLTGDGAWCWFSDPRAVYHDGDYRRTYSGWVDSSGNVVVGYYDHDNGNIHREILHENFEKDDHDNPSFFVDSEGKLMVFYSRHATGTSPIFLARAANAEDISAWEPVQKLRVNDTLAYAGFSNTYTYTNIVQLPAEQDKMYLFWRGADFKPNFSTSADKGQTWDEGKIMVLPERIYKNRRPYMKVASNHKDAIHFAFTDGHPNAEPANSIYYLKYREGSLFKANGEKIMDWKDLPVDPKQADLVYDANVTKHKAWIWDVAENEKGNPVLVYATFPSDSNHVYYYSVYDEGRWNNHRLLDSGPWFPHTRDGAREREPNYSGGIILDHSDPSQVYLSREKNGIFEIERWITRDQGKTWSVQEITRNSKYDNVRPFIVRNHPADSVAVLWMNLQKYAHYTDYRSHIKMSVLQRE